MVAVWIANPGATSPNEVSETPSDMLVRHASEQVWVIDLMNGTEQELIIRQVGNRTSIPDVRVEGYPTIIRSSKLRSS
jgi:hypothetical protein